MERESEVKRMKQLDKFRINDVQYQIVGVLVNKGLSAKEAIAVLDQAKDTYLSRSYHVSSKEKAD